MKHTPQVVVQNSIASPRNDVELSKAEYQRCKFLRSRCCRKTLLIMFAVVFCVSVLMNFLLPFVILKKKKNFERFQQIITRNRGKVVDFDFTKDVYNKDVDILTAAMKSRDGHAVLFIGNEENPSLYRVDERSGTKRAGVENTFILEALPYSGLDTYHADNICWRVKLDKPISFRELVGELYTWLWTNMDRFNLYTEKSICWDFVDSFAEALSKGNTINDVWPNPLMGGKGYRKRQQNCADLGITSNL